jgi:hypothetical protein
VKDKLVTTSFLQYDLETGRLINSEHFQSSVTPSFVAIASNFDLIMVSDKILKHACDEKLPPAKVIKYKWRQNLQDLIMFIELESRPKKEDIKIAIFYNSIEVKVKNGLNGEIEFSGEFYADIDTDESNWEISPGGIEITLQKKVEQGWPNVLRENDQGEELFNKEFVDQVHQKLGHLTSDHPMPEEAEKPGVDGAQLEDCDRTSEFERMVYRFSLKSKEWSHKASVANNSVISTFYQENNIKCLGLRHDVDCCIWNTEEMSSKTPMNHIATYDGIGYVHAGKPSLAFSQCAPNNKFVTLVENSRRAMIYRNRSTGVKTDIVGRQQMINISTNENFVGAACSNNYLYLLTRSKLWIVEVEPIQTDSMLNVLANVMFS